MVYLSCLLVLLISVSSLPAWAETIPRPATTVQGFRELSWLELVPKDWKPQEQIDQTRAQSLNDGDALAQELMRELRRVLDAAPTVGEFDGTRVRLPGYVVPLERAGGAMTEFLLVPYYGACIHTPPPPANQIVHVVADKPQTGYASMAAVWVQGTLRATRHDSGMGVSGYRLDLNGIEPYRRRAR